MRRFTLLTVSLSVPALSSEEDDDGDAVTVELVDTDCDRTSEDEPDEVVVCKDVTAPDIEMLACVVLFEYKAPWTRGSAATAM